MATATGRYVPSGAAADLAAKATAVGGQTNITTSVVTPSLGEVDVRRNHIRVVATNGVGEANALTDLQNAITAVGGLQVMPGTAETTAP